MTAAEDDLDAAASLVEIVDRLYSDFNNRTKWEAQVGSPHIYFAEKATKHYGPETDWSPALVDLLMRNAQTYLFAATQHCAAMAVLLRARHIGVPLAPLTRSTSEAAARAIWLLDDHPELTIRQRCARSLLDQRDGLRRMKQSAKALGHPKLPKIGQELHNLEKKFMPAWFWSSEIHREPNGDLILAKQELKGPAWVVAQAVRIRQSTHLDGAYGYLSSGAHPTFFVIHEMLTTTDLGDGYVRHELDFSDVTYQMQLTANAVADVLHGWLRSATWLGLEDGEELQKALDLLRAFQKAINDAAAAKSNV